MEARCGLDGVDDLCRRPLAQSHPYYRYAGRRPLLLRNVSPLPQHLSSCDRPRDTGTDHWPGYARQSAASHAGGDWVSAVLDCVRVAGNLGANWNPLAAGCVLESMENSTSSIRTGRYVGAYFALWALAFIVLRRSERFEVSEALPALVILGVIFPALAMLATRRVSALHYVVRRPGIETAVLVMYLGGSHGCLSRDSAA